MNETYLPPSPEAKPKRRLPAIAGGVLLVIVVAVAGLLQLVGETATESRTPTAIEEPATVPDPVELDEPAVDPIVGAAVESYPWVEIGVEELEAGRRSAEAFDIVGSARHLETAADAYSEVATIWTGVDSFVSSLTTEIATELRAAADALRDLRVPEATRHIENANGAMGVLNEYLEGLA